MRAVLWSTWLTSNFRLKRASSQQRASPWLAGGSLSANSASQIISNPELTKEEERPQDQKTPGPSSKLGTKSEWYRRARGSSPEGFVSKFLSRRLASNGQGSGPD